MILELNGTKVTIVDKTLGYQGDNLVDTIQVTVDKDSTWNYKLDMYKGKSKCFDSVLMTREGNICTVQLTNEILSYGGRYIFQLRGYTDTQTYHSDIFESWVNASIEYQDDCKQIDCGCDCKLPTEFYQVEDNVTEINNHPPYPGDNNKWMIWDVDKHQYVESDIDVISGGEEYQTKANLTTSVTAQSTDIQYPSAKAVYDAISNASIVTVQFTGRGTDSDPYASSMTYDEIYSAMKADKTVVGVTHGPGNPTLFIAFESWSSSIVFARLVVLGDGGALYERYSVRANGNVDHNVSMLETKGNKVTSLSADSTNAQYPSAKAVYDAIVAAKPEIVTPTAESTATQAASAKAVWDMIGTSDIPKVFIDGEIPTAKEDVLAEMTYISKSESYHAYIKIKCQGTSSMNYPKKNFTVKLYSDETRETKLKKVFRDWKVASEKFVLKANYIDHSHARNIVSANLWAEIVSSRTDYESLPAEMRNSPRNGAVDGFPIKLYTNGTYQGIYTWNISKDDWMWGMNKDNANHVLLCGETNTDGKYSENACNFRALWNGVDGTDWSVEVGTNSDALKTSLNALISCVMNTTDDEFKAQIGTYLDIQSAIDYYLFQYVICGLDGLAKNMLLATYDLSKWYCGAYDMDSTFGLWWTGSKYVSTTYRCPEDYQEQFSLLWERIEELYVDELKARYAELRASILSFSNMVTRFERFTDIIGADLYAEDVSIYSGIPSNTTNNITQIRNYIRDRLTYVDGEIDSLFTRVPCTGITLSSSSLTFTKSGTQTLTATVTPENCTDEVVWSSADNAIAIVTSGTVRAVGNGDTTITATCGDYSASCTVSVSGVEGGTLPSGYAAAEYIESPGGAYIDSGYTPTENTGVEYKIYVGAITAGTWGNVGIRASGTIFLQLTLQNKFVVGRRGNEAPLRDATYETMYEASMFVNDNSYTVNGVTYDDVTVGTTADTQAFRIGAAQNGQGAGAHKIYYIRFYESGELVRNYLPCVNSNGVAGLYETINGAFFTSATSTAYTASV